MRWSLWPLALPLIALRETIYLVRHPKTLRPRAIFTAIPIAALSYALWIADTNPHIVLITQALAIVLYYIIKFREHRRARINRTIKRITS